MPPPVRALARTGAPSVPPPSAELVAAEARLRGVLEQITEIDRELEALSAALRARHVGRAAGAAPPVARGGAPRAGGAVQDGRDAAVRPGADPAPAEAGA